MNNINDAGPFNQQIPEHLIIQINIAESYLDKIINAGGVHGRVDS